MTHDTFVRAKAFLEAKDFNAAIDLLSVALDKIVADAGERSRETAPYYFEYGCALLAKAQAENVVFGEVADGQTEKQRAEQGEQHGDQLGDAEVEEEGASGEGEDEPNDLQLGWEVLEMARLIYAEQTDKESQLRLAAVHARLGDSAMESENFEQAYSEYRQCLQIRTEQLQPSDRLLASVESDLALACLYNEKAQQAAVHYENSSQVFGRMMVAKFVELKEYVLAKCAELDVGTKMESESHADQFAVVATATEHVLTLANEAKEIREIMLDLQERIDELRRPPQAQPVCTSAPAPEHPFEPGSSPAPTSSSPTSSSSDAALGFGDSASVTTIGFGEGGTPGDPGSEVTAFAPPVKRKTPTKQSPKPPAEDTLAAKEAKVAISTSSPDATVGFGDVAGVATIGFGDAEATGCSDPASEVTFVPLVKRRTPTKQQSPKRPAEDTSTSKKSKTAGGV